MKHKTARSKFSLVIALLSALAASGISLPAFAGQIASSAPQTKESPALSANPWWKHAVIYEIYPRSFADAKNKGMGNIAGITSKLDYLKDLGVDAIWITPCYPSPQVDFGYDISNYEDIAPEYGTLADFDKLIAEAKKRNIKIIMDLVMNHTSDKHPWFIESRSSKTNPKRNWYIWRDGKLAGNPPKLDPPNNWLSCFGHSAWQFDEPTKQFYYHFFYPQQPDLNWRNPQVRKAMYDVARFWLDRGVAGFRLDAITTLFEDPNLHDNPVEKGRNAYGDVNMVNLYNDHGPEVHDVLQGLRQVVDGYPGNRVLVGETGGKDIEALSAFYGKNNDEIHLPMNFFFADINKLSAAEFRKQIAAWDANPAHGWPLYLFSNHDQVRHYIRYGDGEHNDRIAKMMACLLFTLRGTPMLYYGEEIGMENNDPKSLEQVHDPIGKIGWPKEKGRDGERTPMQWNAEKNAGFSTVSPWLPVANNYKTHNVASEEKDPHSILNFYKEMIQLRRTNDALKEGSYTALDQDNQNVLSYLRKSDSQNALVALNMSAKPEKVRFDLSLQHLSGKNARLLISNMESAGSAADLETGITLEPFGAYVFNVAAP